MKTQTLTLTAILAVVLLSGCNPEEPKPSDNLTKMREEAAAEAQQSVTFSYEIENIKRRRALFGKPGVVGYTAFLAPMGQPVDYKAVDGKCTSSNKRLTPGQRIETGAGYVQFVMNSPSEDGTFGSSDEYIYCFTPTGQYVQWNGLYYYSDKPFDLTIKPLVVETAEAGKGPVTGQ